MISERCGSSWRSESPRSRLERVRIQRRQGPGAVQLPWYASSFATAVATGTRNRLSGSRMTSRRFGACASCVRFTKAVHCFWVSSAEVKAEVSATGSVSTSVPRFRNVRATASARSCRRRQVGADGPFDTAYSCLLEECLHLCVATPAPAPKRLKCDVHPDLVAVLECVGDRLLGTVDAD